MTGFDWGKHRSNTVYCALVKELWSERMSPPSSVVPSVLLVASASSDVVVCISASLRMTCLQNEECCLNFQVKHAISVLLSSILHVEIQVVESLSHSFSDYPHVISVAK